MKKGIVSVSAAALMLIGTTVFANELQGSVRIYGSTSGASSSVGSSVQSNTSVQSVVNTELGTGIRTVVQTIIGSRTSTSSSGGSAEAESSSSMQGGGKTTVTITGPSNVITVTRESASGSTRIAPSSVSSEAELSQFVEGEINSDDNLSRVETSTDEVVVTYRQHAKLFGFIPLVVNATATVYADGQVDVRYPWYSFLLSTNESKLESAIEGRIEAALKGEGGANVGLDGAEANIEAEASASAQLAAETQAEVIHIVREVMESEFGVDSNLSSGAEASVGVE